MQYLKPERMGVGQFPVCALVVRGPACFSLPSLQPQDYCPEEEVFAGRENYPDMYCDPCRRRARPLNLKGQKRELRDPSAHQDRKPAHGVTGKEVPLGRCRRPRSSLGHPQIALLSLQYRHRLSLVPYMYEVQVWPA